MIRSGVPAPGNSFFLPGDLGVNKYDDILKSMIFATGLKVEKLQLANQAIRPTVFCLHRQLGILPEDTAAVAGHKSVRTQITYKRGDSNWSGKLTAKVQVCTHTHKYGSHTLRYLNLPEFTSIYLNLPQLTSMYLNVPQFTGICFNLLNSASI